MTRSAYQFQTIRSEGAILPPDLLHKIAAGEVEGLAPDAYHLPQGVKLKEAISQSWTRLQAHWRDFRKICATLGDEETGTLATREKWLLPLLNELGYGRLPASKAPEIDGKTYAIDRFYNHAPIHLIGFKLPLDRRTKGARGAATASPHSLLQEFLNRSEAHVWGILSNGLQFRILRDSKALSRQSFVEFDLEAMFEGEIYADFAILWMVAHQSRVESDKAADCWLEKWSKLSHEQGTRILSALRDGVTKAIEILGRGFVGHPRNEKLRDRLRKGELSTQDFYRQLLRTVYRLLFLFVAEDRKLLHPRDAATDACDTYDDHYSTRRLRDLSERMRGSKHVDLWHALSFVFDKLNCPTGCAELGLPAFGSFLWSPAAVPDLAGPAPKGAEPVPNPVLISNEELLSAVRALAFTEDNRVLRAVDYGNIGSEELGSVYESLLELHPQVIAGNTADSSSFELRTAAGNERKTSGSYYTPDSLVQCLLDSALEPVVADTLERARKGPDGKPLTGDTLRESQERAILAFKVCDPACGSGHFLIAAAHRIGAHLARVRGGEVEPSPADYQHAVRDVISHCIYGVDINPMAVELCKVALWMEALEPGKPLSFLDHRIQCGNSLLGVTPALLAKGIPDEAFEPIEGDDKAVCRELKRRNKDERKGQGQLWDAAGRPWERLGNLATAMVALDSVADDTLAGVQDKQRRWQELVQSSGYLSGRLLADAWCAAFVWKRTREMGDAITESVFRRIERNPHDLTPWMRDEIKRLAQHYQFFHPHLDFADVFRVPEQQSESSGHPGWTGGFDVILGNPPWDTLSPDLKEFFAQFAPQIRFSDKGEQGQIVAKLLEDPRTKNAWEQNRRMLYATVQFITLSTRYRLFAKGDLGKGDFNVYRMFVETALDWTRSGGRSAQFTPENLYNGPNAAAIREHIFETTKLELMLGFVNTGGIWFPNVHTAAKFCLYIATIGGTTSSFPTAFRISSIDELLATAANRLLFTVTLVRQVSPDALIIPELESQAAVDVAVKMYERWPKFGDTSRWQSPREYMREVDMGTDRDLFNSIGDGLPVYEGRMVGNFDHRAKGYIAGRGRAAEWEEYAFGDIRKVIRPQWWVAADNIPEKARRRTRLYRIGYCRKTGPTNERSLQVTIIPPNTVSSDSVPTILLENARPWSYILFAAVANSYAIDFLIRRQVSLTLSYAILDSIPIPNPAAGHPGVTRCVELASRLICCGPEMIPLWKQLADEGWVSSPEPEPIEDEELRLQARAELDAIVARDILGLTASEMSFVLEDFPTAAKYDVAQWGSFRRRDLILAHFAGVPPVPARQPIVAPTSSSIDRGRAVAFTTLLLHMWSKPVAREVLEPALILMLNDDIRQAVLGKKKPKKTGAAAGAATIVTGMDQFLQGLQANGVIALQTLRGCHVLSVGPQAVTLDKFPEADKARATEALKAIEIIGESKAMTFVKAMVDEAGLAVPTFAAG